MKIAVIGTGYVGLVTGTCLAEVGHDVICVDIDERKVVRLKEGDIPIYEPGLSDLVHKNHAAGRLAFTTALHEAHAPEVIFFALPTPPRGDGEADLSFVLTASQQVAKVIRSYTVFVNKSTVPVGTAEKVRAELAKHTDVPFDVVSNPEFLREGLAVSDFMQPDRIVVGTSSDRARAVMQELYQPFTANDVPLLLMDEASAEMTKYAANSFLAMKISFMNEVANLCDIVGADVEKVSEGIGLDKRIGHHFLYAGIGYGGSCFPKDVMALQRVAAAHDYDFKLLTAVMDVNVRQKQVLVGKITAALGDDLSGVRVALWGLAFKADTDDIREAPSLEIIRELVGRGAQVCVYDPEAMGNARQVLGDTVQFAESTSAALQGADILVVVTEWKEFIAADLRELAKSLKRKLVFDGRNIFNPQDMEAAGLTYIGIGRGRRA
ncbi:MAG TPA: UDP-glucose/GDP-mannose dehydrogenase family protein [Candidatus Saccharimonadales bacterium]|nr:UDP-glucose/GDP-mannose dehydrogenase family protein [Candidatus Saccharimonadales bacterium]